MGKHCPETQKPRLGARKVEVLAVERFFLPIAEPTTVMVGSTTEINDKTEDDETNNGDNLKRCEPEFELAKVLDTNQIDGGDTK